MGQKGGGLIGQEVLVKEGGGPLRIVAGKGRSGTGQGDLEGQPLGRVSQPCAEIPG